MLDSFRWTAEGLSHSYTHSPPNPLRSRLPHNTEQSFLCYTVGPCHTPSLSEETCKCKASSFPDRAFWFHPYHHTVCSQIWGTQDLGEVCHRGSQDSRKQHNHLDSPAPTHSTPQPRTRSGAKSGEREANLGYFWAKPWMPTRAAHRFTESLTSLVTSLGQSKHLRATEPY